MSYTPRTDAATIMPKDCGTCDFIVPASFARQLERELQSLKSQVNGHEFDLSPAMVQARNDQLNKQLEAMRQERDAVRNSLQRTIADIVAQRDSLAVQLSLMKQT